MYLLFSFVRVPTHSTVTTWGHLEPPPPPPVELGFSISLSFDVADSAAFALKGTTQREGAFPVSQRALQSRGAMFDGYMQWVE